MVKNTKVGELNMRKICCRTLYYALIIAITSTFFGTAQAIAEQKAKFTGKWKLTKIEKVVKGKRTESTVTLEELSLFENGHMIKINQGAFPGVFKIDNKWHKVKGQKVKLYWSLDKKKLFRLVKEKEKRKIHQTLEIRSIDKGLMVVDRVKSTKPGFFKSMMGITMPHEEYENREVRYYNKIDE